MNYVQEFFVSRYIISSKQDRLLYEINSKKRKKILLIIFVMTHSHLLYQIK